MLKASKFILGVKCWLEKLYWIWSVYKIRMMSLFFKEETEVIRWWWPGFSSFIRFFCLYSSNCLEPFCKGYPLPVVSSTFSPKSSRSLTSWCRSSQFLVTDLGLYSLTCLSLFFSSKVLLRRWSVLSVTQFPFPTHLTEAPDASIQTACKICPWKQCCKLRKKNKESLFLKHLSMWPFSAFDTVGNPVFYFLVFLEIICMCFPIVFLHFFCLFVFLNLSPMLKDFRKSMNTMIMAFIFQGR